MGSASQNSPKSDPEARKDTGSDTVTLVLPKNFISHPMITATADRIKLSNPQLMMNASAILVLGWFCINKKKKIIDQLFLSFYAGGVKTEDVKNSINTIRRSRKLKGK